MQEASTKGLRGRSEYQAEYYKTHKKPYMPQTQYVRLVEVRKVINSLKKEIGTNSRDLILDEIEKLEVKKM